MLWATGPCGGQLIPLLKERFRTRTIKITKKTHTNTKTHSQNHTTHFKKMFLTHTDEGNYVTVH